MDDCYGLPPWKPWVISSGKATRCFLGAVAGWQWHDQMYRDETKFGCHLIGIYIYIYIKKNVLVIYIYI